MRQGSLVGSDGPRLAELELELELQLKLEVEVELELVSCIRS